MNIAKLAQAGWTAVETAIDNVVAYVKAHTDAATQAQLAAATEGAKQAASDAVSAGDGAFGQVAAASGDSLVNVFNAGLQSLGYAVGGAPVGAAVGAVETMLKPYEVDSVHRFAAFLKGQVDALTLAALHELAGGSKPQG